jgi:hypothetical protein
MNKVTTGDFVEETVDIHSCFWKLRAGARRITQGVFLDGVSSKWSPRPFDLY